MKYLHLIPLLLLSGCFSRPGDKTGLEGKPLPSFTLQLTDSTRYFNTVQIAEGKPVVLFYLSPHCPYCRAELKDILDDIDKMQNMQFYFVTSFPLSDMVHLYNEYKLSKYPNITVGKDTANFLPDYFKTAFVPYTAIYNKNKKLEKSYTGRIYTKQILSAVED